MLQVDMHCAIQYIVIIVSGHLTCHLPSKSIVARQRIFTALAFAAFDIFSWALQSKRIQTTYKLD